MLNVRRRRHPFEQFFARRMLVGLVKEIAPINQRFGETRGVPYFAEEGLGIMLVRCEFRVRNGADGTHTFAARELVQPKNLLLMLLHDGIIKPPRDLAESGNRYQIPAP